MVFQTYPVFNFVFGKHSGRYLNKDNLTIDGVITLEEASLDLGMNSFQTFRIIILPMVSPGIISSLLIGFVISLDEFIIAFFLTGVEPTLPVYIWAQFRFPAKLPSTMALGTILLLVSLILVSLFEYFRRRLQTYNYFNALELSQNDRWN